ncbi:50S ribosomal protein L23 [Moheibacter sediminis]|uniref:Large ribosomal subunit protein uL23 n=1 Tax=Moheibacter sediminis TaxID=1434700 RepID=A0A1W2AU05_9FLAO|nr:50S ribosomal protein L23 [Moheibacter sediminis]SMC63921.1 large subunit ribosomal protein L23 [Moheibacter sediminis]
MSILIRPVISEKATNTSEVLSQYSFYVNTKANKLQIKDAIQKAYGVDVVKVSTLISAPKVKSRYTKTGVQVGKTNKMKKAIIHIAEGQEIDLFS